MNGAIYIALGLVFLSLAPVHYKRAKGPDSKSPQNNRLAAMLYVIAGAGFFLAAAISFFNAD